MLGYLIWLIMAITTGTTCYFVAKKKGKDAFIWFVAGLVFNLFAVAVIALAKTKQQKT
ncbi:hypothetical protein KAU19_03785 [Candidatus Parcubacteria bacterium]|nr:hypothetical protein [Candidatus Parcubacteria bacterium]